MFNSKKIEELIKANRELNDRIFNLASRVDIVNRDADLKISELRNKMSNSLLDTKRDLQMSIERLKDSKEAPAPIVLFTPEEGSIYLCSRNHYVDGNLFPVKFNKVTSMYYFINSGIDGDKWVSKHDFHLLYKVLEELE